MSSGRSRRIGRADLLRTLVALDEDAMYQSASVLGYLAPRRDRSPFRLPDLSRSLTVSTSQPQPPVLPGGPTASPAVYYRIIDRQPSSLIPEIPPGQPLPKPVWYQATGPLDPEGVIPNPIPPPPQQPLVPWAKLWPVLRNALSEQGRSRQPDMPRIVRSLSQGEWLYRLPRRRRRRWAARVQILVERAGRTRLLNHDYNDLLSRLRRFRGETGLEVLRFEGFPLRGVRVRQGRRLTFRDWRMPPPGTRILLLTDLGVFESSGLTSNAWLDFGQRLQRAGFQPFVLLPVPPRLLPREALALYTCVSWDRGSRMQSLRATPSVDAQIGEAARQHHQEKVMDLLAWLSPAIQVEPVLLRAVRLRLLAEGHDVGHEATAWNNDDVEPALRGVSIVPGRRSFYHQRLKRLVAAHPHLARAIGRLLYESHLHVFPSDRYEEVLIMHHLFDKSLPEEAWLELQAAHEHMRLLIKGSEEQADDLPGLRPFRHHLLKRQPVAMLHDFPCYQSLWALEQLVGGDEVAIPANWDMSNILPFLPVATDGNRHEMALVHQGSQTISLTPWNELATAGKDFLVGSLMARFIIPSSSPLCAVVTSAEITFHPLPISGAEPLALKIGPKSVLHLAGQALHLEEFVTPVWAMGRGCDHQGLYVISQSEHGRHVWYWNPPVLNDGQTWRGFWYALRLPESGPLPIPPWADACQRDQYGLRVRAQGGIAQWFRWIEPGSFLMGSPEDEPDRFDNELLHEVRLSQGFWLGETTVSQALWLRVMGKNPSHFKDDAENPVEQVSWLDAQTFLDRFNTLYPGHDLRLPTEAEWEYACRAGRPGPFWWGSELNPEQANYDGSHPYAHGKKGLFREKTLPGRSLDPNPWGLYQMHGNVWEWCADWYGGYPSGDVVDPHGPPSGDSRVLRGGSWDYYGRLCRSACRDFYVPSFQWLNIGFRLARGHQSGLVRGESGGPPSGSRAGGARGAGEAEAQTPQRKTSVTKTLLKKIFKS